METKHFIFTNLGIGIFDELWLLYRLDIFENTVLPSLSNQTNKDFEWIIFIDKNLSEIFKNRLKKIYLNIKIDMKFIQVDDYSCVSNEIANLIANVDVDYLITTRIDDDDCLHNNAIQLIKENILKYNYDNASLVLSLKNGLEFLPSDSIVRPVEYETLALGLTLVEFARNRKAKCVTQYAHHLILDTLQKQGIKTNFVSIASETPLYLYTKHPLSDSYFFGARARILSDINKQSFNKFKDFNLFGLSENHINHLVSLLQESPIGMPHKYLEKLGQMRLEIKNEITVNVDKNSEKLKILEARKHKLESVAVRPNPSRLSKNKKIRIAILGSCVSRDIFELEKEFLSKFEICFYCARSSIVSYMGLPNTDKRLKIARQGFESIRSAYDLDKSHWYELEISRPDIIILDFIDERIGLIQHYGTTFSASGPIIKAFERANIPFEILRPWNQEVELSRKWSIKYFLERVRSICPNILVHKAAWASKYYDDNNMIHDFKGGKFEKMIELNNTILTNIFSSIEEADVPIDFIGGEIGMIAASKHKWGFSPIHYDERYYKTLAKQIVARVI